MLVHNLEATIDSQLVSFRILPKGVKMKCNGILGGGQSGMILLEAKHMAN